MSHQIESVNSVKQSPDDATLKRLQREFLEHAPHIRRRAAFRFRMIRCPHRHADMVAEAVGLGWKLYLRMHERGIDLTGWDRWFTYMAAQMPVQKRVAGIKRQDILDRGHRIPLNYADCFLADRKGRIDISDMIAFKLDWEEFRAQLSPADRRIVDQLVVSKGLDDASQRLGISARAISRRRCKLAKQWDETQD